MRKIYLVALAAIFAPAVFAQNNVVNGNFELWEDVSNYREPDNWNTNNDEVNAVGSAVYDTTDAYSGDSAVVITSVFIPGINEYVGGFLTNGTNNPDSLGTDGWQINYRPDKLTGYYKYIPDIGDSARIIVYLNKYDNVLGRDTLVATGNTRLATAVDYTYFEIPILNALPGVTLPTPDSYVILIMATKDLQDPKPSKLTIDNLNFIEPVGVPTLGDDASLSVYPNPADDHFVITSTKHGITAVNIISSEGRQVLRQEVVDGTHELRMNTTHLANGFYYAQIVFENGAVETRFITVVK